MSKLDVGKMAARTIQQRAHLSVPLAEIHPDRMKVMVSANDLADFARTVARAAGRVADEWWATNPSDRTLRSPGNAIRAAIRKPRR